MPMEHTRATMSDRKDQNLEEKWTNDDPSVYSKCKSWREKKSGFESMHAGNKSQVQDGETAALFCSCTALSFLRPQPPQHHHRSSTLSSSSSSSRLLSLWVHHCLLGGTLWCASVWPLHATWWECMAPNQVPAFKSTLVLNFSQLNSVMYGKKIFSIGANLNRTSFSFFDWCAIFGICLLKA